MTESFAYPSTSVVSSGRFHGRSADGIQFSLNRRAAHETSPHSYSTKARNCDAAAYREEKNSMAGGVQMATATLRRAVHE